MLLVLSAVTLLTLDFRGFGPLVTVQRGLRSALAPVQSGVEWATGPIVNGARGIVDYGELRDENARLQEEIERLRGEQVQGEVDAELLRRLLDQAQISYVGDLPRVTARVVAGSVGNFDPYSVMIDKGTGDGLAKDMPVVTSAGLVGRIVQADASRSRVQLVTSPQFAVGVRIGQDVTLARGAGSGNPLRATGALAIDSPVAVGDTVFTNGQDRSKFPPDIPVGTVRSVDRSTGSVVLEIDPLANVRGVDLVAIVKFTPPS